MKIILDKNELLALVKKSFPPEMVPAGYVVESVASTGYPDKEYAITFEMEVENK